MSGTMPIQKYRRFTDWYVIPKNFKRTWPDKKIDKAPIWCSVDLRDGNQALINPMNHDRKLAMWNCLVKMGFKEIEVGFPAASETDFDFCRYLIDNKLIPDDVWIQVLTQSREALIRRTVEAVRGAPNIVLHLYNSTSELQRRVVFKESRENIRKLATDGAVLLKKLNAERLQGSKVRLEYSPESFSGTELDFAMETCEAVMDTWGATRASPVIINLPNTVEMAGPNIYADQIEWMHQNFKDRKRVTLSVHPHNDRGCGVAAAELAVQGGADRVEGCLFGCGERTGNVCLITLAMNCFSQGIDPTLDMRDMRSIIEVSDYCTELPVAARHPWAGSLVFTAFSGSHQDAIKKGMEMLPPGCAGGTSGLWEVPYLPIDPTDIGCTYDAVIRVNSQSGKGGCAWILEREMGIALPKIVQADFSKVVQKVTDQTSKEISPEDLCKVFVQTYLTGGSVALQKFQVTREEKESCTLEATVKVDGAVQRWSGTGEGPIAAFVASLQANGYPNLRIASYTQSARKACAQGAASDAVSSVEVHWGGASAYGIAVDADATRSGLLAVCSALNRVLKIRSGTNGGPPPTTPIGQARQTSRPTSPFGGPRVIRSGYPTVVSKASAGLASTVRPAMQGVPVGTGRLYGAPAPFATGSTFARQVTNPVAQPVSYATRPVLSATTVTGPVGQPRRGW